MLAGRELRLWLNVNAETVDIDGKRNVLVSLENITERKQAEQDLKEQAEMLSQSNWALHAMQAQITELNRGLEATVAQRTATI